MCISRKSNRISMASRTCIARECHWTLAASFIIEIMKMIKNPQRIQSFDLAVAALLPVNPPEIHTFSLSRMMKILKICLHKFRACRITYNRVLIFIIHAHFLCHINIHLFAALHTIRWMHIQGSMHSSVMEFSKKALRIREKLFVPGISCPSASVFRVHINLMPVHIYYGYCEWDVLFIEFVHQLHIAFF